MTRSLSRNIIVRMVGFALGMLLLLVGVGTTTAAAENVGSPSPVSSQKERPNAGERALVSCGYYSGTATTKRGDTGNRVREVQCLLIFWGYNPGSVDGVFGANTERAVREFQEDTFVFCARQLLIDGIVGVNTWRALRAPDGCP